MFIHFKFNNHCFSERKRSGQYKIPIIDSLDSCSSSTDTHIKIIADSDCDIFRENFDGVNVLFDISCEDGEKNLDALTICLAVIIPSVFISAAIITLCIPSVRQKIFGTT